ncbi:hypothetical protein ACFZDB_24040 [Streptomyces luteogriseus]|uniref:hypothetical protein n=1 Tax=Streptomyces luteogriseus TaxID=68233 RepID=UPI0036E5D9BD
MGAVKLALVLGQRRIRGTVVGGELLVLAPFLPGLVDRPPQVGVLVGLQADRDEHARSDPGRDQLAAVCAANLLDPQRLDLAVRLNDLVHRRRQRLSRHVTDKFRDVARQRGRLSVEVDLKAPPERLDRDVIAPLAELLSGLLRLGDLLL